MNAFVALLRAVNVGGRKLLMEDLKRVASELGLGTPRTFIASGNLLFTSAMPEAEIKRVLERAIGAHMGNSVAVMVRSADELAGVVARDPFAECPGNRVAVIFLDEPPPHDAISAATNVADERMAVGAREIYAYYPRGMGTSKLRIPAAASGTARNMNSVAKLAGLAKEMA